MHSKQAGKSILKLIAGGLLSLLLLGQTGCENANLSQQRFLQFGTLIDITLISTRKSQAESTYAKIEELLITRHTQWHGWLDGTLKQFNQSLLRQPKEGILIPETLKTLILDSKKYYQLSSGLFNPAMGQLIAAWGFHENADTNPEAINRIKKDIPGMHDLIIKKDRAYSINPDLQLDFGAIAKGLAIRQIAQIIKQNNIQNFIINAGGDIYAHGLKHAKSWRVAIEHPFKTGIIGSLDMQSGSSIFTSGDYRRHYEDNNQPRRHHIIDPRSGEPSRLISSATVIHADPVTADVAATTLMLTEISQLQSMASRLGIDQYLVITRDSQVYVSHSMMSKINWLNKGEFSLTIQ